MPVTTLDNALIKQRIGQLRSRPQNPTFRKYTNDLCRFLCYEAVRNFKLVPHNIQSWIGALEVKNFKDKTPTAVPILRAGLGMLDGFLDIFPDAPVSMVGFARNEKTLEPVPYYNKLVDNISERTAFILDPMLATGGSINATIDLLKLANCQRICVLCLIASADGVKNVLELHPDVHIFTCCIDEILNAKGYILPGLGDAGDLIFGT